MLEKDIVNTQYVVAFLHLWKANKPKKYVLKLYQVHMICACWVLL